jgi:hypothetical protein
LQINQAGLDAPEANAPGLQEGWTFFLDGTLAQNPEQGWTLARLLQLQVGAAVFFGLEVLADNPGGWT